LLNNSPSNPEDLVLKAIPVPPICIRPTVPMGDGKTNEDDLTIKLLEIQKQLKQIQTSLDEG
jgi:DNA-directed RNA polymerase III subunit RPC1